MTDHDHYTDDDTELFSLALSEKPELRSRLERRRVGVKLVWPMFVAGLMVLGLIVAILVWPR